MSSDHSADVQRYIDGVRDGSIVTGRLQRLAVHRHCDDLEFAGERGFYFNEKRAWNAIDFSLCCHHFKGEWAGLPFALRSEQKFIAWCLFGWLKKSDHNRRFCHAQLEVARKMGKSSMAAYLACLLTFSDCPLEPAVEGACVATDRDQAKVVWEMTAQMIRKSPDLAERCRIVGGLQGAHSIALPDGGWFKPLSTDNSGDSFSLHFLIKDEEHAYRKQHESMMKALSSGFGARRQPLTITITTYGDDKSDIWKAHHDYAVRCVESVISGDVVDDTWFAFIAAIDYPNEMPCFRCLGCECPWCHGTGTIAPDDPFDESCWGKANPGLPLTPKLDELRTFAHTARQMGDTREFFQKRLNIIVSSRARVILPETWEKSRGELTGPDVIPLVTCGGLDCGRCNDFSAICRCSCFAGVDDFGEPFRRYEAETKSWTVEDRPKELQIPMIEDWIRLGHIEQCSGDSVDFLYLQEEILAWHRLGGYKTWAYDIQYAKPIAQWLVNEGVEVFPFTQGPKYYTAPLNEFLKLLGKFRTVDGVQVPLFKHNGCPCLAWQAGNLVTIRDARGGLMPDKSSDRNKIDAMVAILMAFSECLYHQKDSVQGYYLTNSLAIGGTLKAVAAAEKQA